MTRRLCEPLVSCGHPAAQKWLLFALADAAIRACTLAGLHDCESLTWRMKIIAGRALGMVQAPLRCYHDYPRYFLLLCLLADVCVLCVSVHIPECDKYSDAWLNAQATRTRFPTPACLSECAEYSASNSSPHTHVPHKFCRRALRYTVGCSAAVCLQWLPLPGGNLIGHVIHLRFCWRYSIAT
jgi:hypothetical protein